MEPLEKGAKEGRQGVLQLLLCGLQLVDEFLDLRSVEPLIVLSLGGKLEVIWLLLALDELVRDLELVPELSMTPVDSSLVLVLLSHAL